MEAYRGIRLDVAGTEDFLPRAELDELSAAVAAVAADLEAGRCAGADFLGWRDLPVAVQAAELKAMADEGRRIEDQAEVVVVVGIGGSYLGAHAVLAALGRDGSQQADTGPEVLFAGTGLCAATLQRVLDRIADRDFHVCVISKSGTTLEPAVAFRILWDKLKRRYGDGAAARVTAITDAKRGALRKLADQEGFATFVIPDDVGGRFSVLTPVGLVPLAAAGIDIAGLVSGARGMREACLSPELRTNPAHLYAAVRHGLYRKGFTVEILSSFHGDLRLLQEWWKQLFGESEGKQGRGIFPASAVFTTDLHSLGQYIQDGRRNLLETFLTVRHSGAEIAVPTADAGAADGLGYLEGVSLDAINAKAYAGTRTAHITGGVPCLGFELERLDPETMGAMIYLFEKAVAISGLLLEVNPFDQPGVEMYKREMFRLLGKP